MILVPLPFLVELMSAPFSRITERTVDEGFPEIQKCVLLAEFGARREDGQEDLPFSPRLEAVVTGRVLPLWKGSPVRSTQRMPSRTLRSERRRRPRLVRVVG